MLLGASGTGAVAQAAEAIGLISNVAQLASAFDQLIQDGKVKQFRIAFSFDASPGRHTIGAGFRVNVSGAVTGCAFAVMAGQVSSIVVSGLGGPVIPNVPWLGTVSVGQVGRQRRSRARAR